jgi:hypothetical protein
MHITLSGYHFCNTKVGTLIYITGKILGKKLLDGPERVMGKVTLSLLLLPPNLQISTAFEHGSFLVLIS